MALTLSPNMTSKRQDDVVEEVDKSYRLNLGVYDIVLRDIESNKTVLYHF